MCSFVFNDPLFLWICQSYASCRPVTDRSTKGAVGSLLTIRIVAISSTPAPVGFYITVKSICSPGGTTSGVPRVGSTEKLVEPIRRYTLPMTKSSTTPPSRPTLNTCNVRYCGP